MAFAKLSAVVRDVPTHVGVNRYKMARRIEWDRCPHARGGEPRPP